MRTKNGVLQKAIALQHRNRPVGITVEDCLRISQSERVLYPLQTQSI